MLKASKFEQRADCSIYTQERLQHGLWLVIATRGIPRQIGFPVLERQRRVDRVPSSLSWGLVYGAGHGASRASMVKHCLPGVWFQNTSTSESRVNENVAHSSYVVSSLTL